MKKNVKKISLLIFPVGFLFFMILPNKYLKINGNIQLAQYKVKSLIFPYLYSNHSKIITIDSVKKYKKYEITKFSRLFFEEVPRHAYAKHQAYTAINKNNNKEIFIFSANGNSYKLSNDNSVNINDTNELNVQKIKTNLEDIVIYPPFFLPKPSNNPGIKDVHISKNGNFYIVHTDRDIKNDCNFINVLKSKPLDNNKLIFKKIFSTECAPRNNTRGTGWTGRYAAHMFGGRLTISNNEDFAYLSTGMINDYRYPQSDNSSYGKLLRFPIEPVKPLKVGISDNRVSVVAKGLRNPQGLDASASFLMISSHGPKGGDVLNYVNLFKKQPLNFGWPIVSYGTHYDGSFGVNAPSYAPLFQEPKKYGFLEAFRSYTPSIGPSQVQIQPSQGNIYNVYLAAMGYTEGQKNQRAIHHMTVNLLADNSIKEIEYNVIPTGGRVRDIEKNNKYIWFWDEANMQLGHIVEKK